MEAYIPTEHRQILTTLNGITSTVTSAMITFHLTNNIITKCKTGKVHPRTLFEGPEYQ
jgi:hypothetical protein